MSMRGLSRFCNIPFSTLRESILVKLEENSLNGNNLPEVLKPLYGKAFHRTVLGEKGAKIVTAEAVEAIIFYEMTEKNNETAKYAYRKFAQKGIHQWIKETVGYIEQQNQDKLLTMMQEVLQKVETLTEVCKKYNTIREKTTTVMPGAGVLLDKLEQPSDNDVLPPESGVFPDGKYSLEAWLYYEKKRLTMPKNTFLSLSHIVAGTYRSLVGQDPEKRHCVVDGRKKYNVSVYAREHFTILQIALNKFLA